MRTDQSVTIRRSDYTPTSHHIEAIDLVFDLLPESTLVRSQMKVRRRAGAAVDAPLELHGEGLELLELRVDGRLLRADEYQLDETSLRISGMPAEFSLSVLNRIKPIANTELSGLYVSNGNFYTQCEAEGFRRITFFADRPDVMTRYRVMLRADQARWPVLLSNGNLLETGRCDDGPGEHGLDRSGWHWALWEDPFPKPSYLFALVAGKLVATESHFMRRSGRPALLQVWVEPGNEDKTDHAMRSLERSIRWDEERFGLELDLDRFMIVAVSDFNMGAMENKGLNIFNTRYVFAHPRIATDQDFAGVESVVAHEYFHNWTGNRVTCRDWFQLTLKEGLTVFRDQEFSADMMAAQCASEAEAASARAVNRINDVRVLRTVQFAEDAGPMAHPIRPDSYQEINNFYTVTVYEKGAEVIRMMQTLAGRDGFRKGMDLYFARHDGQAVTCDDFIAAIADANDLDLTQFARWYQQAGTPRLKVEAHYDAAARSYRLDISQRCPPTPGQGDKPPLHIPLALGLVGPDGRDIDLHPADDATRKAIRSITQGTALIDLRESQQSLRFEQVATAPFASIARGFSAPVIVEFDQTLEQLSHLAAHDSDPFNRWEAGQQLMIGCIRATLEGHATEPQAAALCRAIRRVIEDPLLDAAFKEAAISLPGESFIAEQLDVIDPEALRAARQSVRLLIANELSAHWFALYRELDDGKPWAPDLASAGRRALKNAALAYWVETGAAEAIEAASRQFGSTDNMTDQAAALSALLRTSGLIREQALARFEHDYADEALVMDKWFSLQATAHRLDAQAPVLETVRRLMQHPAFSMRNPNKVRALVTAFCTGNLAEFHATDGSGYDFWAEQVIALDGLNPQLAARLGRALDRWRKFTPERQRLMRGALERVAAHPGLSRDLGEIVGKALANG